MTVGLQENYDLTKSFFNVMSEVFFLNIICSEGPISIIKFQFYEGPIIFASKPRLTYLIKSNFYVISEFFL